jgi:hypothetical protein
VTGLPAAVRKPMVYEAPGAPEIWITSLLGRAGENVGPAKYGQLPSTLLTGTFQTWVPDRDTPVPSTVPVAVF